MSIKITNQDKETIERCRQWLEMIEELDLPISALDTSPLIVKLADRVEELEKERQKEE